MAMPSGSPLQSFGTGGETPVRIYHVRYDNTQHYTAPRPDNLVHVYRYDMRLVRSFLAPGQPSASQKLHYGKIRLFLDPWNRGVENMPPLPLQGPREAALSVVVSYTSLRAETASSGRSLEAPPI